MEDVYTQIVSLAETNRRNQSGAMALRRYIRNRRGGSGTFESILASSTSENVEKRGEEVRCTR